MEHRCFDRDITLNRSQFKNAFKLTVSERDIKKARRIGQGEMKWEEDEQEDNTFPSLIESVTRWDEGWDEEVTKQELSLSTKEREQNGFQTNYSNSN